jgi:hypothetical protein
MTSLWNLEAVLVGEVFTVGFHHFVMLLVPHIADALEEYQWENVAFPIRAIDRRAAENVGSFPKAKSKFVYRNLRH